MADVLCSIEEARQAGSLQLFEKKTRYHDYRFLVRSEEEIRFNISQNISAKPTGGEYFKPLFIPHYSNGQPMISLADLDQEDVWLDAGSHIGTFSVRMLTQFPRIKKMYAYEPFHNNVEFANVNLEMNGVRDRCEVVEKALVSNGDSMVEFFLSHDSGKHSVHPVHGRPSILVPAENINDVIRDKGITCIKMDIEGMEYEMIKSITEWKNIKLIIVEYHFHYSWLLENRAAKFDEIMTIMESNFDHVYVNRKAPTHKHFITHFAAFKNT